MAQKTKNWGLALPEQNATNWGGAINNNFMIIDNRSVELTNQANALQSKVDLISNIRFDDDIKYLQIESDMNISLGTFNGGNFTATNGYHNQPATKLLESLPDYQAYIVTNDDNLTSPALSLHTGDILVKYSSIENNSREAQYMIYAQSLGGFYEMTDITLDHNSWKLKMKWEKKISPGAPDTAEYTIQFPVPYTNGSTLYAPLYNSDTENLSGQSIIPDNKFYLINSYRYYLKIKLGGVTSNETETPPHVDCTFFTVDDQNAAQKQYRQSHFDYFLKYEDDRWCIYVTTTDTQTYWDEDNWDTIRRKSYALIHWYKPGFNEPQS